MGTGMPNKSPPKRAENCWVLSYLPHGTAIEL